MAAPSFPRPAARMSDATFHGGSIVQGTFKVRIGGLPAARKGDKHLCPVVDGVKPHEGGVITQGSATVRIDGARAARFFDRVGCNTTGSSGKGAPTVIRAGSAEHRLTPTGEVFEAHAAELLDGEMTLGNATGEINDFRVKGEVSALQGKGRGKNQEGEERDIEFNSAHVELREGLLIGKHGENYGLGVEMGVTAAFVDAKVSADRKPVPYLDSLLNRIGYQVQYQHSESLAYGAGAGGGLHAFYNDEVDEFRLGGMISALFFGAEVDVIFTEAGPGPGAGVAGTGVAGIPNLVFGGEPTVWIGG